MIGFLVSNISCKKNQIVEPEIVFGDSLLVNILTDSYILNSAFNQTYGIAKDSIGDIYSQEILDRYQISQSLLEANMEWMYRDPLRVDTIFQLMLDRLDYLEERISKEESKPGG
jgi:hypothetical protein